MLVVNFSIGSAFQSLPKCDANIFIFIMWELLHGMPSHIHIISTLLALIASRIHYISGGNDIESCKRKESDIMK